MPDEEDIIKAYEDYFTHENPELNNSDRRPPTFLNKSFRFISTGYLAQRFGYATGKSSYQKLLGFLLYLFPPRRHIMDLSVMGLRFQTGGRLLDVGCGSGYLVEFLRDLGWEAEGVEVDPLAVQRSIEKGLKVRLGSLEAQQYPDNFFAAITMNHVIEHVHDPLSLFKECRRILQPGGRLVVVTPNFESWGHKLYRDSWFGLDPPRHLFLFTCQSLQCLAERAGFIVRSLATSARIAPLIYLASRATPTSATYRICSISPVKQRIGARFFFWLQWAALKIKPRLGEELFLSGQK